MIDILISVVVVASISIIVQVISIIIIILLGLQTKNILKSIENDAKNYFLTF